MSIKMQTMYLFRRYPNFGIVMRVCQTYRSSTGNVRNKSHTRMTMPETVDMVNVAAPCKTVTNTGIHSQVRYLVARSMFNISIGSDVNKEGAMSSARKQDASVSGARKP